MISVQELNKVEADFKEDLKKVENLKDLENLKVQYLGKKGILTEFFKKMGSLSPEEKKEFGQTVNQVKNVISENLEECQQKLTEQLKQEKIRKETIDITLPGRKIPRGATHPITRVIQDMTRIFNRLGFSVEEGPEMEREYYNFDALNIPEHHPARDEQDSFYIKDDFLLRTQTSGVQIRVMEKKNPPLAIVAPGRCFRKDTVDATHSPIFHQIEGLLVDKNVSFSDLKGVLSLFAREMFGKDTKVRFRPDFFPFTEPSAEVAFTCFACGGKGCSVCKKSGWIEVAGCGMVDPEVFKYVNIDYEKYKGYAFGIGVERIALLKYKIPDIRMLYENDMNFLNQFQ
jgi:phenylalanyl-tRNA synthetase alpha chain